eukprot:m.389257 g.389257  ORF g.389257 m.389257 type:complete len:457 (+) comp21049_c0_seq1:161-1531(+)
MPGVCEMEEEPENDSLSGCDARTKADRGVVQESRSFMPEEAVCLNDVECSLCLRILYDPVTTTCGHSYCKTCLYEAMRSAPKCPICRCPMPPYSSPDGMAVNKLLHRLVGSKFPVEMRARRDEELEDLRMTAPAAGGEMHHASRPAAEHEHLDTEDTSTSAPETTEMPLFILDPMLPRQSIYLHVFEPRYVNLVNDCLAGGRRFGMVGTTRRQHRGHPPAVVQCGTEVEIVEILRHSSGRYDVKCIGKRIFRVQDSWRHDHGYPVARVEWVQFGDAAPELPLESRVGNEQHRDLMLSSAALEPALNSWMERIRQGGWERRPTQLNTLLEELGPLPAATHPDARALWVAALINPLPALGVAPEIRTLVLGARSTQERLDVVSAALETSLRFVTPSPFSAALRTALNKVGIHMSPAAIRLSVSLLPWFCVLLAIVVRLWTSTDEETGADGSDVPTAAS